MRMPIAYAINNEYTKPLMAQLIALYEHAHEDTIYDIYILSYKLENSNKELIDHLVKELNNEASVIFLDLNDQEYHAIPQVGIWPREVNFRALLPRMLPDMNCILYLDADTLVLEDLSHLLQIPLVNHPYAAVCDVAAQHQNMRRIAVVEQDYRSVEIVDSFGYINSGVLLMNLDFWRDHRWSELFFEILHKTKHLEPAIFPDQDVLNYLAIRDGINRIYYLPTTYNNLFLHMMCNTHNNRIYMGEIRNTGEFMERAEMFKRNRDVDRESSSLLHDRVSIIHFCSWKPWSAKRGSDHFVPLFTPYAQRVGLDIPPMEFPKLKTLVGKVKDTLRPKHLFRKYKKEKLAILSIFFLGVITGYCLTMF
ncbi:glycosyltransferase family 8 protein [Entomospira nematocerorum]|uniref:Glycosyltransferase family 8 protein n=1 Tax=Entomospira nematocerorum TaxID=2719987 RepID=A0A968KTD5_9SPIO|nr:glycosyltransferase family 8 protein [Entomospira nematocera]NIZ47296.1 glycosyltransferase family 8 protein [Entomospira nematocera]WDI34162.1 glycosyltransferase family 8 protein [Entomospira nematocera]